MGASIDLLELSRAVAQHICDLIALSMGAHRDATALLGQRGVRAARLQAIKADIAARFNDFELTVSAVALRHGVTPRYIQKLFEDDGVTFSEYVLGRRLAEAHRSLADPHLANRSISTIAFNAGFSDLSYFNRTYRRRFGATPTETRVSRRRGLHQRGDSLYGDRRETLMQYEKESCIGRWRDVDEAQSSTSAKGGDERYPVTLNPGLRPIPAVPRATPPVGYPPPFLPF